MSDGRALLSPQVEKGIGSFCHISSCFWETFLKIESYTSLFVLQYILCWAKMLSLTHKQSRHRFSIFRIGYLGIKCCQKTYHLCICIFIFLVHFLRRRKKEIHVTGEKKRRCWLLFFPAAKFYYLELISAIFSSYEPCLKEIVWCQISWAS